MFTPRLRLARATRFALLALPLAFLAGCVKEQTDGSSSTFTYELWVPALIFLGGVAAAPLGWVLRQKSGRLGWGLMIAGPVAALVFAPTMFLDKIVVDADHFQVRTGIVGMAETHSIKFADLKAVHLTVKTSRGRRGRKTTKEYLVCESKTGNRTEVEMSGRLATAAARPLAVQFANHQIEVIDETGTAEE